MPRLTLVRSSGIGFSITNKCYKHEPSRKRLKQKQFSVNVFHPMYASITHQSDRSLIYTNKTHLGASLSLRRYVYVFLPWH